MLKESMTNSLCHLLLKNEKERAHAIYLRQPRKGGWDELTWGDVMIKARKVAAFLLHIGLQRGSHVSIISKNCAEWFIVDFGLSLAGMVSVPLFPNQHDESIHYVLKHADVQFVFIGKLDDHLKVRQFIPQHYKTASFDYHDDMEVEYSWTMIMDSQPLSHIVHPAPDELYTIIYTSGTGGTPKGAMYTHQIIANYLTAFSEDIRRIRVLKHYQFVSYLPLAHIYERSTIELGSVLLPSNVSFIESLDKFVSNLREIKPVFFTAVPRIWGVFQQKIEQKISNKSLSCLVKIPLISSLIKRHIRKQLGFDNCLNYFSGASLLPVSIYQFFEKIGVLIQEGYGQTENMAYATFSILGERKSGYVGTPRLYVDIKLSENNEVLIKSSCLMTGYYKDSNSTNKAFTPDGWLKTGDIGEFDSFGRLKIISRISDIFKNQSGEFISPTPIEKKFLTNGDIEYLCLVGSGLPKNILIINLTKEALMHGNKESITKTLQSQLSSINSQLTKYEKISHIIISNEDWTTINDLLTPTLKVRRRAVEEHYTPLIQTVLKQHNNVVWES